MRTLWGTSQHSLILVFKVSLWPLFENKTLPGLRMAEEGQVTELVGCAVRQWCGLAAHGRGVEKGWHLGQALHTAGWPGTGTRTALSLSSSETRQQVPLPWKWALWGRGPQLAWLVLFQGPQNGRRYGRQGLACPVPGPEQRPWPSLLWKLFTKTLASSSLPPGLWTRQARDCYPRAVGGETSALGMRVTKLRDREAL